MNERVREPHTLSTYLIGIVIFVAVYFLGGFGLHGFSDAIVYKTLLVLIGRPMGVAATANADGLLAISLKVEIAQLLFSPGLYSGAFIGYRIATTPRDALKGMIPSLVVMAPLLLLAVIPNPSTLFALHYLLIVLSLSFPYALVGAFAGWQVRTTFTNSSRNTLSSLILLLIAAVRADAYGPAIGHRYIADRAIAVLDRDNTDRYGEIVFFNPAISDGAELEDGAGGARGPLHFYNPFTSRANRGLVTLSDYTFGTYTNFDNSVGVAQGLWTEALAAYNSGDKVGAYIKLGRVAHLVTGDTYQPAHTHDDPHAPHFIGGDSEVIETYFDVNTSIVTALGLTVRTAVTGPLTGAGVAAFGDVTSREAFIGSIFPGQLSIPDPVGEGEPIVGFINLPDGVRLDMHYVAADPLSSIPYKHLRIGNTNPLIYDPVIRGDIGLLMSGIARIQDFWELPSDEQAAVGGGQKFYFDQYARVSVSGQQLSERYIRQFVPGAISYTAGLLIAGVKAFDPVNPRLTLRQNDAQGAVINDGGFSGAKVLIQAKDPAGDETGGDPAHPTPSGIFKIRVKNLDTGAQVPVTPEIATTGEKFVERTLENLAEGRYEVRIYDGAGNDTSVIFKVDKTPPDLHVFALDGQRMSTTTAVSSVGPYNTQSFMIAAYDNDGGGIASLSAYRLNGGLARSQEFTPAVENAEWVYAEDVSFLPQDQYVVVAVDAAGNADSRIVEIKRTPFTILLDGQPTAGTAIYFSSSSQVNVSISNTETLIREAQLYRFDPSGPTLIDSQLFHQGTESVSFSNDFIRPGYRVRVQDMEGNFALAQWTVDFTPPTLSARSVERPSLGGEVVSGPFNSEVEQTRWLHNDLISMTQPVGIRFTLNDEAALKRFLVEREGFGALMDVRYQATGTLARTSSAEGRVFDDGRGYRATVEDMLGRKAGFRFDVDSLPPKLTKLELVINPDLSVEANAVAYDTTAFVSRIVAIELPLIGAVTPPTPGPDPPLLSKSAVLPLPQSVLSSTHSSSRHLIAAVDASGLVDLFNPVIFGRNDFADRGLALAGPFANANWFRPGEEGGQAINANMGARLNAVAMADNGCALRSGAPTACLETAPPASCGSVKLSARAQAVGGDEAVPIRSLNRVTETVVFDSAGGAEALPLVFGTDVQFKLETNDAGDACYALGGNLVYDLSALSGTASTSAPVVALMPGQNVTAGIANMTVTLANVTPGPQNVIMLAQVAVTPPVGFRFLPRESLARDLIISAEYQGPLQLSMPYNRGSLTLAQQQAIRMYHLAASGWEDVTTAVDTDNAVVLGQSSSASPFALFIPTAALSADTSPPVTTLSIAGPNADAGGGALYLRQGTPLSLSAQDDQNMVNGMVYAVDPPESLLALGLNSSTAGRFARYFRPIILEEGRHLLVWGSIDTAGNHEVLKSQLFFVDGATPSPQLSVSGSTVSITAADPVSAGVASGVSGIRYLVDVSSASCAGVAFDSAAARGTCANPVYAGPFQLSRGTHTIHYGAADLVQNEVQLTTAIAIVGDYEFLRAFGSFGSGPGQFDRPVGVAIANGSFIYVTDSGNSRVQVFNAEGAFFTSFGSAGSGPGQFGADIQMAVAGPAADAGGTGETVVVADPGNHRIQRFSATGAFLGAFGSQGSGPGQFESLYWVATDSVSTPIYATDEALHRVQQFAFDGTFMRSWGSRGSGPGEFEGPRGIAVKAGDAGVVLVVDAGNRRVQTFTRSGGFLGQWPLAGAVDPQGLEIDEDGTVYISDPGQDRVLLYDLNGTPKGTLGGPGGGPLAFNRPLGLAADVVRRVYVADSLNHRIQVLRTPSADRAPPSAVGNLELLSVSPVSAQIRFTAPSDELGRVRQYQARLSTRSLADAADFDAATVNIAQFPLVPAAPGALESPRVPGLTPGGIFFAAIRPIDDSGNYGPISQLSIATPLRVPVGVLSIWAGTGLTGAPNDGVLATRTIAATPRQLALAPDGDLIFAQTGNGSTQGVTAVRRIDSQTLLISRMAGRLSPRLGFSGDGGPALDAELNMPSGVALAQNGDLYIADSGNHRIRRVDAATGVIQTIAGDGTAGFAGDGGPAAGARFNDPARLRLAPNGDLYIADRGNHRVRVIRAGSGTIETVAGNGATDSAGDGGPATAASINRPGTPIFDESGNMYVGDIGGHRVRRVDAQTGIITTIAGTGVAGGAGDGGPALTAQLDGPGASVFDPLGRLYVAENSGHRIRRIDPDGSIHRVAGTGTAGTAGRDGPALSAQINNPAGMTLDAARGMLYIAESGSGFISVLGVEPFQASASTITVGGSPELVLESTGSFSIAAVSTAAGTGAVALASAAAQGLAAVSTVYDISREDAGAQAKITLLFDPVGVDTTTLAIWRYDGVAWSSTTILNQLVVIEGGVGKVTGDVMLTSLFALFTQRTDAQAPLVRLDYPSPAAKEVERALGGVVSVAGAVAEAGAVQWRLEAAPGYGASEGFELIASGAGDISGALGSWDLRQKAGPHTLRLTARDAAGNEASVSAPVFAGPPAFAYSIGRRDADAIVSSLKNPAGIAARADGSLWVSSEDQLLLLSSSGAVLATIEGHERGRGKHKGRKTLAAPKGLALDASGFLYVADKGRDRVLKLSADGREIVLELDELKDPWDVAVDANGEIYAADSGRGRVRVYDAQGAELRVIGEHALSSTGVRGLALTAEGLWVSDREQEALLLFSRQGALLRRVGDADSVAGELSRTRGLAADALGALYVLEPSRDRAQKFDPAGRGLLAFGQKSKSRHHERRSRRFLDQPVDAALGPDGSLWIADSGRDRVVRYQLPSGTGAIASWRRHRRADPAAREIDPVEGAVVERDDGTGVRVPRRALRRRLTITVEDAPDEERKKPARLAEASEPVHFGPSGTQFDSPVTLTIAYDPEQVAAAGLKEESLAVHYWNPLRKDWEKLASTVDVKAKTVSAPSTHFSVYQVLGSGAGISPLGDPTLGFKAVYAFPNPVRATKLVTLRVQPGLVDSLEVHVYDAAGRRVHASSDFRNRGSFDDGNGLGAQYTYEHVWDVSGIGSGVYTYVVTVRKAGEKDMRKTGRLGVVK